MTVLAIDLPGRRGKPGDLIGARVGNWVQSVVADIETAADRLRHHRRPFDGRALFSRRDHEARFVASARDGHGGCALSHRDGACHGGHGSRVFGLVRTPHREAQPSEGQSLRIANSVGDIARSVTG